MLDTSAAQRHDRLVRHLTTTSICWADASNVDVAASPPPFAAGDAIDIVGTHKAAA